MDKDLQVDTLFTELPTVRELANALKERIEAHEGGIGAVWERIDTRLKVEESESATISGLKEENPNKITKTAFYRAFQRLDKDAKTEENMKFGIRGNPVLMMNVFHILGIDGYKDLVTPSFQEPDIYGTLFALTSEIQTMHASLEKLAEDVAILSGKKPRINTKKLTGDLLAITARLHSVFTNQKDMKYDDPKHFILETSTQYTKLSRLQQKLITASRHESKHILEEIADEQRQLVKAKYISDLGRIFITSDDTVEHRQVLFLQNLLEEYSEYYVKDTLLLSHCKRWSHFDVGGMDKMSTMENSPVYILEPLYALAFYLPIVIRYLSILPDNKGNPAEEKLLGYIHSFEIEGKGETGNSHTKSISTLEYLEKKARSMNNAIRKMLELFNRESIRHTASQFSVYLALAASTLAVFNTIFVESVSEDEMREFALSFKNTEQIRSMQNLSLQVIFQLNKDTIQQLESCNEEVAQLLAETRRDINER